MGQVNVAEGKCAWNKRAIGRIELPLDPIRPNPIEIVLNRLGIDQPPRVEEDPGPKKLDRFRHLGGFRELPEPAKKLHRIEESICPRHARGKESPRQPAQYSHFEGLLSNYL